MIIINLAVFIQHRDRFQIFTGIKGIFSNTDDTVRERNSGQSLTVRKCQIADACCICRKPAGSYGAEIPAI